MSAVYVTIRAGHAGDGRLDPFQHGGELGDALLDHLAAAAQLPHPLGEGGVPGADPGEVEAGLGLLWARTGLLQQQGADPLRPDLGQLVQAAQHPGVVLEADRAEEALDRKSTRLNSSHVAISYAVFCLKKKTRTAQG